MADGRLAEGWQAEIPRTRHELEQFLDDLIRENRFTISVFFPLVGAILLVGSALDLVPEPFKFHPLLILTGTFVMRSPLIVGVLPTGTRKTGVAVGVLALYAYVIEYVGIHTGYPYGEFQYVVDLGPRVGGVPLGLPVFFIPLVANAYLLCLLLLGDRAESGPVRLLTVIAAVLAMDLVLDPGAVAIGFWEYNLAGVSLVYYGVPWTNYAGWVLSATVAVVLLDYGFDRPALLARLENCEFMLDDMVSFVILWGCINAAFGNWLAVAVAGLFGLGLLRTDRFDTGLFRVWN